LKINTIALNLNLKIYQPYRC